MKQQTLPTLPEFINKVRNREDNLETIDPISPFAQSLKDLQLIYDFTDKIMQQPHLSNFIPCVEENGGWKPIEEPTMESIKKMPLTSEGWDGKYWRLKDQYKTALSKVLFSGWEYNNKNNCVETKTEKGILSIYFGSLYIALFLNNSEIAEIKNLNDLTTLNIPLTETGVIHFNLKF